MPAKVAVIIVNYNAGDYLKRCLECVLLQSFTDFEVILVDNASQDGSINQLPQDTRLKLIRSTTNLGFAAANNVGALQTDAPWIACLNPDAFPAKDWLQQLMFATIRFPKIMMFGSTQINANRPSELDGAGDVYHIFGIPYRGHYRWPLSTLPATGETFAPCAAAALYNHEIFREAGGFDESFFCYGEDVDLGFRFRWLGQQAVQVREAVVYHVGSAIAGQNSVFQTYYGVRNRIWTWLKNMPLLLMPISLPPLIIMHGLLGVKAVRLGHGLPFLKAIKDALWGMEPVLQKRKLIQSSRKVSIFAIAKAISWNILALKNRRSDIRVYPKPTERKPFKPKY
ncbi:MAG: glycosyltransferase family 2 protein [Alphaproteobacteria bacterium]|nr:glycosyltransferase family 2 protein [Alphaproteobacteria bacterium]